MEYLRFLGWGKFGMITAPFLNITIRQVEEMGPVLG
jgi:hypothetical protein